MLASWLKLLGLVHNCAVCECSLLCLRAGIVGGAAANEDLPCDGEGDVVNNTCATCQWHTHRDVAPDVVIKHV